MQKSRLIAALSMFALFAACGDSGSVAYTSASLKTGATLDSLQACSVESPSCPSGTSCAVVKLDTGIVGPQCFPDNICDSLKCATGICVALESFPVQIVCGN